MIFSKKPRPQGGGTTMKSIGNLLGNEGTYAAAVLALSGTLMTLVAKGNGPISLKGIVAGTLSNPIP
jgi:hypothetical protein